mgnify:CR=1 FL=1
MEHENSYKTYMWQLVHGEPWYRFQTDDPAIRRKMLRRSGFRESGWGENVDGYWVFQARISTPQSALRTLRRITGSKPEKDASEEVFLAKTHTIVT